MSHRSEVATKGSIPIAACSAAWAAPGIAASGTPAAPRKSAGSVHQTALVGSDRAGRSSRCSPMTSPVGNRRRNEVTWVRTRTSPK